MRHHPHTGSPQRTGAGVSNPCTNEDAGRGEGDGWDDGDGGGEEDGRDVGEGRGGRRYRRSLSLAVVSPEVSPGGAHTHALYTPRGAPRVPQSMRLPVVPVDGTKALKTKHGLSEQSKGGRVRPKAPHQKAPNGGGDRVRRS